MQGNTNNGFVINAETISSTIKLQNTLVTTEITSTVPVLTEYNKHHKAASEGYMS